MPIGEANLDVLAAAREGLRPAIRAAIEKATAKWEQITVVGRVRREGESVAVSVTARLMTSAGQDLILLSFVDLPKANPKTETEVEPPAEISRVARMEEELDATRKERGRHPRPRDRRDARQSATDNPRSVQFDHFESTFSSLSKSTGPWSVVKTGTRDALL